MTKYLITSSLLLLLLSACAEDATSNNNQTAKPSKFKVAAIEKIKAANGISYEQASCVVESMLADDQYGLGEINQMKLTPETLSENSSGLLKAYQKATKACQ